MVTIKASYVVTPSEATPECSLWLSDSDQGAVRCSHAQVIYIYKGKHNYGDVTDRMRDSLTKVLVHYYPAAGRLSWIEGGRMKLDCNAKGVMLLEAESDKTLAEYGDFSPKEPIKELVPMVDYSQPLEEIPLVLAQLTRFRDDEGVAIGISFCHPLSDGLCAIYFTNAWAKVARGDALGQDEMPFLDRTILKSPRHPSAPIFDHPEFRPFPLVMGCSDSMAEQKKKTTTVLLKLTAEQVEKLRKMANDGEFHKKGSRPYSKFEAISAHIWRSASKSRQLDQSQPTIVRTIVDFRSRLNPPLPQYYFGNALAPTVTSTCCVGDIISKSLGYGAQKMREAVEKLTDEYIRSQLDFTARQENLDSMRPSFGEKEERRDVPFYGNPNLYITSWLSMPVYDADFGWGKPLHFGPAVTLSFDKATVVRSPDGDGSILVFMHYQVANLQSFLKFFWEDL